MTLVILKVESREEVGEKWGEDGAKTAGSDGRIVGKDLGQEEIVDSEVQVLEIKVPEIELVLIELTVEKEVTMARIEIIVEIEETEDVEMVVKRLLKTTTMFFHEDSRNCLPISSSTYLPIYLPEPT